MEGDRVEMVINGHCLTGQLVNHQVQGHGRRWRWICSFPELARKYSGRLEATDMIAHFMDLATRSPAEELPTPRRSAV